MQRSYRLLVPMKEIVTHLYTNVHQCCCQSGASATSLKIPLCPCNSPRLVPTIRLWCAHAPSACNITLGCFCLHMPKFVPAKALKRLAEALSVAALNFIQS